MDPIFRKKQKVILIDNYASSRFNKGQIGYVADLQVSDSFHAKKMDRYVYLIKDKSGYYDTGGTWSFACDLKLFIIDLNKNTRTI